MICVLLKNNKLTLPINKVVKSRTTGLAKFGCKSIVRLMSQLPDSSNIEPGQLP